MIMQDMTVLQKYFFVSIYFSIFCSLIIAFSFSVLPKRGTNLKVPTQCLISSCHCVCFFFLLMLFFATSCLAALHYNYPISFYLSVLVVLFFFLLFLWLPFSHFFSAKQLHSHLSLPNASCEPLVSSPLRQIFPWEDSGSYLWLLVIAASLQIISYQCRYERKLGTLS